MNTFENHYKYLVRKDLIMRFQYDDISQIPNLSKIVINIGLKEGAINKKRIISTLLALELLTGQHPTVTTSKKAIANFNLKMNQPIGCKVTLHKNKMYNFLFKFTNSVIYLNKSFNGLNSQSLNNTFNYGLGIKDLSLFPEITQYYENFDALKGMDIVFNTSAKTKEESKFILSSFRLPFIK